MISCLICDNNEMVSFDYPNAKDYLFKNSNILVCKKCFFGKLVRDIDPFKLNKYYQENYGSVAKRHKYTSVKEYFQKTSKMYKKTRSLSQINLLKKFKKINLIENVLEIGPGLGTFCYFLKKKNSNIRYHVIEYEKKAIEHMKFLKSKVFKSLDEVDNNHFDLIVTSHALEHCQSNELLYNVNQYYKKLKKDGLILLEVPLVNFILNNSFQKKQEHEPHTLFFSLDSISNLFKKNNFEILFINTVGEFLYKNQLFKFFYKIQSYFLNKNLSLFEYGGNRRCLRAIIKKRI